MRTLPTTMHAVLLTGHGGYDKLEYTSDAPVPTPKSGEVLIKVSASGVNNTDVNTRIGWYSKSDNVNDVDGWNGESCQFPRIQGADVCGEIVAVCPNVDVSRLGERVIIEPCLQEVAGQALQHPWYFGSECDGGFAEYVTVASRHAFAVHCTLTDTELASFPCSYSTAENMLTKAKVKSTETVLVTGASGGVGSAAVQLSKARGAKIIAVCSDHKFDDVLGVGADQVISRTKSLVDSLGENQVDVVIDLVAGKQWPELLSVLKPGGCYVVSGAIAGPMVELDVRTLYLKDLSFFGCTVLQPEVFPNLVKQIERGDVQPLIAEIFALKNIVEAQKMFLQKNHTGKIVLKVS